MILRFKSKEQKIILKENKGNFFCLFCLNNSEKWTSQIVRGKEIISEKIICKICKKECENVDTNNMGK